MELTRVFIVTPSYNCAEFLERTLMSVAAQAGSFELHHHVQDGGSNDDTSAILERWASLVEYGLLPKLCQKFTFSYAIESDNGMYDAIVKGFSRHAGGPEDWLSWINADDILMPGALETLARIDASDLEEVTWLTGATTMSDGAALQTTPGVKFVRSVIAAGLCEGLNWNFIQSEGTFFRSSLWRSIDSRREFANFELAGDWNLWRRFAQYAELFQIERPLGVFFKRSGQLSASRRSEYMAEIDRIVPLCERRSALAGVLGQEPMRKIIVLGGTPESPARIEISSASNHVKYWQNKNSVIQVNASISSINQKDSSFKPYRLSENSSVFVHNADWQFPAITEQHAFKKVAERMSENTSVTYLAFPWATFIDLRNNFKDYRVLQSRLDEIRHLIEDDARVVTVCQHIHLKRIIGLMEGLGVTDVFWTHAVRGETQIGNVRIHPFPLFPVQVVEDAPPLEKRKLLFSFVGARPNKWYLTEIRNWIIDLLSDDDRGFVAGRSQWHYNKIVYDHQIRKQAAASSPLLDSKASDQFKSVLADTVFALCPSGSGPNSIRLWEAIGSGAVPVIMADTWAPPGNEALWLEACVFCPETPEDVRALPGRLEAMRQDSALMTRKMNALRQLWSLYGPDTFVTDIEALAVDEANQRSAAELERRSGSGSGAKIKVHVYGRHAPRTPLSYPALRPYFAGRIDFTSTARDADFLVVGFDVDLRENAEAILNILKANPRLKIVVISEEPLWDTVWSTGWTEREARIKLGDRSVAITVLNHVTSNIFNFEKLPYYITTRDSYALRYARRLYDVSGVSPAERLRMWAEAPIGAGIYAERREGQKFAFERPEHDIVGLCDYRTRFAAALSGKPGVLLEGKGWSSEQPRQSLPDWHLDKLVSLDGQTRIASALENTHHPCYITEKLFDAYAVGAIPVYYASEGHRVNAFAQSASFINVYGESPETAAERAQNFEPTLATAEAWIETARRLHGRFANPGNLCAERQRIANEIVAELVQMQHSQVMLTA